MNLAAFLAYYALSYYFVRSQSTIILSPGIYSTGAFYLLLLTSSMLLTLAVYAIGRRARPSVDALGGAGALTALVGSLVFSCGCAEPVFFSLVALGLSSSSALSLDLAFSAYSLQILLLIVAFNILAIYYYLGRLSNPSCFTRRRGNK